MTLAELEAAVGWLERNRVSDHLELIRDDHRYAWSVRQTRARQTEKLSDEKRPPPVSSEPCASR